VRSIVTGSLAIAAAYDSKVAWDEDILQFAVREPFPRLTSWRTGGAD
jgi:hypothetical protein